MNYGYARVSTREQNLEAQKEMLTKAGVDQIFEEKYTGTTVNRPVFKKLLTILKKGDKLTVTKLDRFARNTTEALSTIKYLFKQGITINILNMGTIDDTPTGQLTVSIFSAIAQFDRDMIITRTQEGKEYARKHNPDYHEGRKNKYSDQQIREFYQLYKRGTPVMNITKSTGISRATLYRRFNKLTLEKQL